MAEVAEVALDPHPASARQAREFVGSVLRASGADEVTEDAVLLTCELVTNVIRHVQSSVTVTVAFEDRRVRITVSDDSRAPLRSQERIRPWDNSGRGLQLVDAMASDWGVKPAHEGKAVWFELAA